MYWPENIHEPKQYGDLVVETVSNSTVNFYEFRIFKIKLVSTVLHVYLYIESFDINLTKKVITKDIISIVKAYVVESMFVRPFVHM